MSSCKGEGQLLSYPHPAHREDRASQVIDLCRQYPLALFCTVIECQQYATRIPIAIDVHEGKIVRARGHLNANNPQAVNLHGRDSLIAFCGPDAYISPFWRAAHDRGPTWDYTAVYLRGRITVRNDDEFFRTLIEDIAALGEATDPELVAERAWSLDDVTDDYITRLRPYLITFEIKVTNQEQIFKCHQDFSAKDRRAIHSHLMRSSRDFSRRIASLIVT